MVLLRRHLVKFNPELQRNADSRIPI